MIKKIISGGQTGADQAALDYAIDKNIAHGGWIPKGRMTEQGSLPDHYNLTEMTTKSYAKRTEKNVVESDGTVIITYGRLTKGCLLTKNKAVAHGRPYLYLNMERLDPLQASDLLRDFLKNKCIRVLNVAGSRASKHPPIYSVTKVILSHCFDV